MINNANKVGKSNKKMFVFDSRFYDKDWVFKKRGLEMISEIKITMKIIKKCAI